MRRGIRCSIALLVGFMGTAHAQYVEFRQLRVGMTLEEVQAMTPGIEWTYVPSSSADRPSEEIEAPNIISFGGRLFTARIYQGSDNRHRMTFRREETVPDAAACKAQGSALIADLESKVGNFEWPRKLLDGGQLVHVGARSTARVSGWSTAVRPTPRKQTRGASATGFGLRSRRSVGEGADRIQMDVIAELKKHSCVLEFAVQRGLT